MSLTKKERDSLLDDQFALPAKRQIPIHDEQHIKSGWSALKLSNKLTSDELELAKSRILIAALAAGMDTSDWGIPIENDKQNNDEVPNKDDIKHKIESTNGTVLEILIAALLLMNKSFLKLYLVRLDLFYDLDVSDSQESDLVASTDKRAKELIDLLNKTTVSELEKDLKLGYTDFDIRKVFDEKVLNRLSNISLTESTRSAGSMSLLANKISGIKYQSWLTKRDAKVRTTHNAMEGQTIEVGRYFTSPSGAMTLFPGGFGLPEEDNGCRCVLVGRNSIKASKHYQADEWEYLDKHRIEQQKIFMESLIKIFNSQMEGVLSNPVEIDAESSINCEIGNVIFSLDAMALDTPETPGHINKMPFSGILTFLDVASDNAPLGSGGRKVMLTKEAAEKCLPTLLGMAVDYKEDMDGHDPTRKIGIIDCANIVDDKIEISGFIYAADFPTVAKQIKDDASSLGFSWELKQINVVDPRANPWVILDATFTGAAILKKEKAAYTTTSLQAAAEEELPMSVSEEILSTLKALSAQTSAIEERLTTLEAPKAEVNAGTCHDFQTKVATHAAALNKCADDMEADGVGCHATNGHVTHLRRVAAHMTAEAAKGVVPGRFNHYESMASAAITGVAPVISPVEPSPDLAAAKETINQLTDKLASLTTVVADMKASAAAAVAPPVRKTSPQSAVWAQRAGFDLEVLSASGEALTLSVLNAALDKAGINGVKAMNLKAALRSEGKLA